LISGNLGSISAETYESKVEAEEDLAKAFSLFQSIIPLFSF